MVRSPWRRSVLVVSLALLASACQSPPATRESGTAQGAAHIDRVARARADIVLQVALETLPSNQTKSWHLSDETASGSVTPLRTFKIASGHYCREFLESILSDRGRITTQSVACRSDDGYWRVVDKGPTKQS